MPLGPTGYGASPYQSFSTFAGNPYYIDLEKLVEEGYLTWGECNSYDFGDNIHYIDYEKLYHAKFAILRVAYNKACGMAVENRGDYQEFVRENSFWPTIRRRARA